ncbi:MAG TPA: FAD/NAD(P)-binding protein [Pseudonocardiaceae bacterium]
MSEREPERRSVAIIGAGAAGTMTAIRLLRRAARSRVPLRVLLIDRGSAVGRGLAYATEDRRHLLNVPAGRMSADPDRPLDFVRWLASSTGRPVGEHEFAPRVAFGRYLADRLADARRACAPATVRRISACVMDVRCEPDGVRLRLDSGALLDADGAVLAIGVFPPSCAWAPEDLRSSPRFVADPWAPGALDSVPPSEDVLLVGTGLTMIDLALSLDRPGRALHAVSRHGLLPQAHAGTPGAPAILPALPGPVGLDSLRATVIRQVAVARRGTGDWRAAIDGVRPFAATWWTSLPIADRARFLQRDRRIWDVHRHRMPASTAAHIADLRSRGRLVVHTGEVTGVARTGTRLCVRLSTGISLPVGAVLNCTGAQEELGKTGDALVEDLLSTGRARPGPLGLGLDTSVDGRLLPGDHELPTAPLWTLGSIRRGNLWETTAFPEIRAQSDQIAADVMATVDRTGQPCHN